MKKQLKRLSSSLHPKRLQKNFATKQTIMNFAEDNGFVYFGRVHHGDEDLQIVRGLTLSKTHRDNHYCVGSLRGYDLSVVERNDTLYFPRKLSHHHEWLIFSFDLKTSVHIPHMVICNNHYGPEFSDLIETKFERLQSVAVGTFGAYDPQFTKNYTIFSEITHSLDSERLIDPEMAATIMAHFGKLSIEIVENTVHIYADHMKITTGLLETILKNGMWLVAAIDKNSEKLL